MQNYLAQVDKQRLSRGRLHLVMQRKDETWVTVLPMESIPLPSDYHHLTEGLLVLLDLDEKGGAKNITPALTDLIRILQDSSLRLLKYKKQEEEMRIWRESLEFQAAQLFARAEDFERREELLKLREIQVVELLKKMN